MRKDEVVFLPGEPAPYVWFPSNGIISIVALDQEGSAIEVAIVGREGMTGLPTVLGSDSIIYTSMVQVPGNGCRGSRRRRSENIIEAARRSRP